MSVANKVETVNWTAQEGQLQTSAMYTKGGATLTLSFNTQSIALAATDLQNLITDLSTILADFQIP